jgi:hypothetical protein
VVAHEHSELGFWRENLTCHSHRDIIGCDISDLPMINLGTIVRIRSIRIDQHQCAAITIRILSGVAKWNLFSVEIQFSQHFVQENHSITQDVTTEMGVRFM